VLAVLGAFLVFMLLDFVALLALVEMNLLNVPDLVVVMLGVAVVALMSFFAILGRPSYRFLPPTAKGPPLLRMEPDRTFVLSTSYAVIDDQGSAWPGCEPTTLPMPCASAGTFTMPMRLCG